jgi:hypothetical protein
MCRAIIACAVAPIGKRHAVSDFVGSTDGREPLDSAHEAALEFFFILISELAACIWRQLWPMRQHDRTQFPELRLGGEKRRDRRRSSPAASRFNWFAACSGAPSHWLPHMLGTSY